MTQHPQDDPLFILSIGTQVVALIEIRGTDGRPVHPRGAVGVVSQAPADPRQTYRVKFPDEFETNLHRTEMAILAHYQVGGVIEKPVEGDLSQHLIYRCVIGSRAYGLDDADSDTDRRGIYLPPAELHWSLKGVPDHLEIPATEDFYWEAHKFLTLALKANPNVLECLYTPLVEHATPTARELLDIRQSLLSRMVYQTYNGYVMSQFKKLQADVRNQSQVKWKHVMHLLRLLLAGITVLEEGQVQIHVGDHRDRLLAVKHGELSLEQCHTWRLELHQRFDAALERSPLPERPDYAAANDWLLRARRSMVRPLASAQLNV